MLPRAFCSALCWCTAAFGLASLAHAAPAKSSRAKPVEHAAARSEATDPRRGTSTRSIGSLPEARPATPATPKAAPLDSAAHAAAPSAASKPRSADAAPTSKPRSADAAPTSKHASARPEKPSARRGRPPHTPAASLPANAPRPEPDRAARQKVADGPTDDDLRAGKDDPELSSLHAAERVLFPRPLSGVEPGWSWDLPAPVAGEAPELVDSGLPPRAHLHLAERDVFEGQPDAAWLRGLLMPNLPVRLDELVLKYLRFYRDDPSGKAIARVWAKKSGRFAQAIKAAFARAGLPTDLVWVSLIESGHNPSIVSPAGAVGLWQFMPEAARIYGLNVDRWVDERLDPERSTEAASRYLSDLYRRFGSWELSLASYNMGYAGLSRAIRKFNTNDFWELTRYEAGVPWETALYVPKILAIAIVMNNKRAFSLDGIVPDEPASFDVVLVGPGVALSEVARAAGVADAEVLELNPQYLAGRTPPLAPGEPRLGFRVRVPAGKGDTCSRALAHGPLPEDTYDTYAVKFGDTVEAIALSRSLDVSELRALNQVDAKEVLTPGTLLLLPHAPDKAAPADPDDAVVVVPPREFAYVGRSRVFYRVLPGDTLQGVADAFGVPTSDVTLWNALDRSARLQPGMALQLFVHEGRDLTRVRYVDPRSTRVLVAGSPEFYDYFEAQNGRRRVVVAARAGDTLARVGRRYGMTAGSVERVNRRSRNDKLKLGEPIVVYVDQGRSPPPSKPELEAFTASAGVPAGAPSGEAARLPIETAGFKSP